MLIPELGLYHYRARTYSAYLGRFLQADPAGYADGLNLYAYVGNDPINATDPSGMFRLSDLFNSSFLPRFDSSSGGGGSLGGEEVTDFGEIVVVGKKYTFSPFIRLSGSGGGGGYINEPREMDDKQQQICNKPNEGGKGKTLRQRASIARAQAASNTAIGSIIGLITGGGKGAVVGGAAGYGITAAAYANGLRTGGSLVSGGGSQGNRAYGAVAAGLGVPLEIALRFAGFYEQYGAPSNGEYDAKNGTFLGAPPYGDDPGAQDAIREGYACAAN